MGDRPVFAYPAFVRLWLSDTTKWVGLFTSGLALQLLLIETLDADQTDLGWVRAAQWLPMLLFGLVVGVLDRPGTAPSGAGRGGRGLRRGVRRDRGARPAGAS